VRETILQEIQKLAKANDGQPPGVRAFQQHTGIGEHLWRGVYWARWGDAIKEAGFTANEWQGKSDTGRIFEKYIEAARHYGYLPTAAELLMYRKAHVDFPGVKTIYTHFGSKEGLLANLRSWIRDRPAMQDVAQMLGAPEADPAEKHAPSREGLGQRFLGSNHIRQPRRVCKTMCGRPGGD
jgi:hypothetical protein